MNPDHNPPPHPQKAPQGTILEVQHTPTLNGEVIHTSIVLKGHPLQVLWRNSSVHHTNKPELHWIEENCIYCQQCNQVCPNGCLHISDDGLEIKHNDFELCGNCIKECPSMALEMIGQRITAGDLLHKTLKQNYETARKIKQITITGGEPGLQSAFCADLLFQIEAASIPAILETSGLAEYKDLLPLLSRPTQINFELITTNNQLHTRLTGYGNTLILENLIKIAHEIGSATNLVVRTPLIRNQTAVEDVLTQTGRWLAENLDEKCNRWECFEPQVVCQEITPFNPAEMGQIEEWAASTGFPKEKIRVITQLGQSTPKETQGKN